MHRTGLARSGDDDAVRWIAVRHAPDHIHIVATLARQDGTRPRIWNDFYRVREACQAVERRYGLRVTAPGDRTAGRRPNPGGEGAGSSARLGGAARPMLRRAVHMAAAGASSEQEFFTRLEAAGLLVRKRASWCPAERRGTPPHLERSKQYCCPSRPHDPVVRLHRSGSGCRCGLGRI
jgi:hypothetical protein